MEETMRHRIFEIRAKLVAAVRTNVGLWYLSRYEALPGWENANLIRWALIESRKEHKDGKNV